MASLKNYSTKVPARQTIGEIEESLVKHGASDIWKQYDDKGNITTLNFAIITEFGKLPFKLGINIEAVRQIIKDQKRAGNVKGISQMQAQDTEHARNVGWRILKDWIDSQMALVEIKMRKLEQIFLADIWDARTGKTLYDVLAEGKFTKFLMEAQA